MLANCSKLVQKRFVWCLTDKNKKKLQFSISATKDGGYEFVHQCYFSVHLRKKILSFQTA